MKSGYGYYETYTRAISPQHALLPMVRACSIELTPGRWSHPVYTHAGTDGHWLVILDSFGHPLRRKPAQVRLAA